MENPKVVASSFAALLVGVGVFCLVLAVYERDLGPLVAWGTMLVALGIFSVIAFVLHTITVFPLMLLVGKIFARTKKECSFLRQNKDTAKRDPGNVKRSSIS